MTACRREIVAELPKCQIRCTEPKTRTKEFVLKKFNFEHLDLIIIIIIKSHPRYSVGTGILVFPRAA